jgi:hypothetical protein
MVLNLLAVLFAQVLGLYLALAATGTLRHQSFSENVSDCFASALMILVLQAAYVVVVFFLFFWLWLAGQLMDVRAAVLSLIVLPMALSLGAWYRMIKKDYGNGVLNWFLFVIFTGLSYGLMAPILIGLSRGS